MQDDVIVNFNYTKYCIFMSWTEEKVIKLKELWGKGQTASQIAEIIGGVSRNAVIGKAHRLNLNKDFEPAKNLSLEELTEDTCKYMEGNPNEKDARFCGRKNVEKFSYCPLHLMIVFQPKGKKEDIVEKDDEMPKFIQKKIKSA